MGAWGKSSFQNDSGLDFIPSLINFKNLKKLVSRKNIGYYYDEIRISAEILLHLHKIHDLWTDQLIIDQLIECLEIILSDEEWFESWNDSRDARDIRKNIKRLIKGLSNVEGY